MNESLKNRLNQILIICILLLGVILRLKTYVDARPLWHDEASLAMNIVNRGLLGFFTPLDFLQKAPPFFMMLTESITIFLGENETALRFLPFLASISSMGLFYLLSKKVLNKPYAIIISNFLFAVNYGFIYYAQEFKQYSTDVLALLLSFILLEKLNFENLTYKQILKYSALSIALILFSHPMFIVISAIILLKLIKHKKEYLKQQFTYAMPIVITGSLYFVLVLLPARLIEIKLFSSYWDSGFITFNIIEIIKMIQTNLIYYFQPNVITIPATILILLGMYLFMREDKKYQHFMFLILLLAFLASLMHLYPLKERISLYLVPIIILFIAKPFDLIKKEKKALGIFILTITLFFISFKDYNLDYLKRITNPNTFKMQDSRATMHFVATKFKENDCLIYNDASKSDFAYYSNYFSFNPVKKILLTPQKYDKKTYIDMLNKLPKNQSYWFYFPYDYYTKPVRFFLKEWAQQKNNSEKLTEFSYKRSSALYIKL